MLILSEIPKGRVKWENNEIINLMVRTRERDFLKQVHETIQNGGKVLIPVFALGRAQVKYS